MKTILARGALAIALFACGLTIQKTRPVLAQGFHRAKATSDVYTLPSPQQTVALSLGYRAALADYLWANVLVEYGLHFQERRRFEFVGDYLDAINALDPRFRQPYAFADTLLTLQPRPPTRQDYEKAREILRRGMKQLPYDQELWSTAGQFLAYLAPAHLKDEATKKRWRVEGARALSRACQLASDNQNIPYHCVAAVGILNRAGEREAMIQMISRSLAVNDDPKIREILLASLQKHVNERERERYADRLEAFQAAWQQDLPFVSKDQLLLLGPRFEPARCAGIDGAHAPGCAVTWREWVRRYQERQRTEME